MINPPAKSTAHAVLGRTNLTERRMPRRCRTQRTALNHATSTRGLWCADYKGEFLVGNK